MGDAGRANLARRQGRGGDLPVEFGFAVTNAEADRFLELVRGERVSLFYLRPIEFDVINGELLPSA